MRTVVRQIADRILADEYHTKFYGPDLTDRTAPECGHLYARVAIEKLHKDTHDFAVATVKEVDSLSERIEGVSERIDATAAAVEQQMEMLLAAGQGAQQFQE